MNVVSVLVPITFHKLTKWNALLELYITALFNLIVSFSSVTWTEQVPYFECVFTHLYSKVISCIHIKLNTTNVAIIFIWMTQLAWWLDHHQKKNKVDKLARWHQVKQRRVLKTSGAVEFGLTTDQRPTIHFPWKVNCTGLVLTSTVYYCCFIALAINCCCTVFPSPACTKVWRQSLTVKPVDSKVVLVSCSAACLVTACLVDGSILSNIDGAL